MMIPMVGRMTYSVRCELAIRKEILLKGPQVSMNALKERSTSSRWKDVGERV